jgi:hypothetical protein
MLKKFTLLFVALLSVAGHAQISSANIIQWQLQPKPGNPPANSVYMYFDSITGNLVCLNSSGATTACSSGGGGTVTSVTGTANQIDVATGTTTPVISIDSNYLLAPGPIGSGTPSTGAFTTLSASSTVSGSGFSTYLASPPAIGGTAPAAGTFTTLNVTGSCTGCQAGRQAANSSSDQLTSSGSFATTLSQPGTNLVAGSIITIKAHGVFTTSATASPTFQPQVNAGNTSPVCPGSTAAFTPPVSTTAGYWDLVCYIQIVTTGTPGTAYAWGTYNLTNSTGAASIIKTAAFANASTVSYTTTAAETVSVQLVNTFVSGQTFNLQALNIVVNY